MINRISYYKFTDEILELFPYVIKLDVCWNSKVKNVNHMKNLRILNAGCDCGIDDMSLVQLVNLTQLDVRDNNKVKNVNHMANLRILNAASYCGMDDTGLCGFYC